MIAARNTAFSDKKDLHVGGLGADAQPALATMADDSVADHTARESIDALRPYLKRTRAALDHANLALRDNPWAAAGLVAALGLTVGYLLSRRT